MSRTKARSTLLAALCYGLLGCTALTSCATPAERVTPGGGLTAAFAGADGPSSSPIDAFWTRALEGNVMPYRPPSAVVAYRSGEAPPTACADLLTHEGWANNAFYCPEDASIAYDTEFVDVLAGEDLPFAGVAILAHEWGHHVQALRGTGRYSIQQELQADCYAGMFLSDYEITTGDDGLFDDFGATLFELGNSAYSGVGWFTVDEHGSPAQRLAAWALGFHSVVGGLEFCDGYSAWHPNARAEISGYKLTELPGRFGEVSPEGHYHLEDDDLPALRIEPTGPLPPAGEASLPSMVAARYGSDVLLTEGPFEVGPDLTLIWIERQTDDAGEALHEVIGLLRPAGAGDGLMITATVSPEVALADLEAGALLAAQVVTTAGTRICAPGQTASPGQPAYNEWCAEDL